MRRPDALDMAREDLRRWGWWGTLWRALLILALAAALTFDGRVK